MAIQFLTDVNADSGTLYVDAAAGTVGIGTTSPTDRLQVTGSGGTSLTSTQAVALTVKGGGNSSNIQVWGSSSSQATYAVLTSSGNFGIGTTSPSSKLHVSGTSLVTGSVTGAIAQFTNTSSTGGAGVQIQGGPSSGGVILKLSDYQGNQRLLVAGDGNTQIAGSVTIDTIANAAGDTDKFLVSNSGIVQYRTGAQLAADIGAVTGGPFLPLAGGTMTGNTLHGDNVKSLYGAGNDLELYHDATNTYITNDTGDLYIRNNDNDKDIIFQSDNGAGGVSAYLTLDGSAARTIASKDIQFNDNVYARFGNATNGDLIIGHTNFGSPVNSISSPDGTTSLKISASNLILESANAETYIDCNFNSSVDLYHNNVKKFATLSTGASVTGKLGIDTTSPNTQIEVYNNNDQAATLRLATSATTGGEVASEISFAFDETTVGGKIESVINSNEDGVDFKFYNGSATPTVTITGSDIDFNSYTSTSVSTTGPINANQNQQAPSQDTLAALCVDPSGNVVRGEQEATFTFTLAQLNSTLGQTLISAPGADKAVVVTYTDWMMKYSSTGTTTNNLEIRQANLAQANASVSVLPALRFNEIVNQSQSGSAPFYGFYTRDIPTGSGSQGRTYAVNKATTIHKQNAGTYPSGLTSISIKIRYRIFDVDTF